MDLDDWTSILESRLQDIADAAQDDPALMEQYKDLIRDLYHSVESRDISEIESSLRRAPDNPVASFRDLARGLEDIFAESSMDQKDSFLDGSWAKRLLRDL
jgi:hypothetical protein